MAILFGGCPIPAYITGMNTLIENSIWPAELVRYKEIIDNDPFLATLPEEDKVRVADRIMNSTYADLTNDWAFKWVFLNNPDLLIMLLKDILNEDIVEIEYLPSEGLSASLTDKKATMDVTCRTSDGRQFVVEMQTNRKSDFRNRMFYYGAAAIHRQVKARDKKYIYDSVRVIAILDFVTNHGKTPKDKVLFQYEFREIETMERYGTQMMLYMLELPRMRKAIKDQNNLEEWCYMFRNFPKFVGMPEDINPRFHKLMDALRLNNMTEEQKQAYFKSSIYEELADIAEANYEYYKEEASREIAAKLLSEGVAMEIILRVTGLSEEDLKILKQ